MASQPKLPAPGDVERLRGRGVLEGGEPEVQGRAGPLRYTWQRETQTKLAFYLLFLKPNLGKRRAPCSWQNEVTLCRKYMPKKVIPVDTAARAMWSGSRGEPARLQRPHSDARLPDSPFQPPTSAPAPASRLGIPHTAPAPHRSPLLHPHRPAGSGFLCPS